MKSRSSRGTSADWFGKDLHVKRCPCNQRQLFTVYFYCVSHASSPSVMMLKRNHRDTTVTDTTWSRKQSAPALLFQSLLPMLCTGQHGNYIFYLKQREGLALLANLYQATLLVFNRDRKSIHAKETHGSYAASRKLSRSNTDCSMLIWCVVGIRLFSWKKMVDSIASSRATENSVLRSMVLRPFSRKASIMFQMSTKCTASRGWRR